MSKTFSLADANPVMRLKERWERARKAIVVLFVSLTHIRCHGGENADMRCTGYFNYRPLRYAINYSQVTTTNAYSFIVSGTRTSSDFNTAM
jgi:hypothetical protein